MHPSHRARPSRINFLANELLVTCRKWSFTEFPMAGQTKLPFNFNLSSRVKTASQSFLLGSCLGLNDGSRFRFLNPCTIG